MSYRVITHSGKAHIDEIMAIGALSLAKNEEPECILRLSDEELKSFIDENTEQVETWIIDCGMKYDPQRRLFDHHHDSNLDSAALLIFRHFFPDLIETSLGHFFCLVSKADTEGIKSLGESDKDSQVLEYFSLPHRMLVKAFESEALCVVKIIKRGLFDMLRFEESKRCASEWLADSRRLADVQIAGHTVLEYKEMPPIEIVDGLKGIDSEYIEEHSAIAVYGFDKVDPEIRTLYRTNPGHEILDFTRAKYSRPLFIHQNGFLARFKPKDKDEWRRIIAESLIKASDQAT